jgi:hypothetical protein
MLFLTVYARLCAWYGERDSQLILGKMKLMEEGNIRVKSATKWVTKCELRSHVSENAAFLLAKSMAQNRLPKEWLRDFGYYGWEAHAILGFRKRGLEGSRKPYTVA